MAAPGLAGYPLADLLDLGAGIEAAVQKRLDLARLDAEHGFVGSYQPLLDHVDGDVDGGLGGALGGPRLEHVELAAFDRELEVLDVAVVVLQLLGDLLELLVDLRQVALQRVDALGLADAGDDVLTLRIEEVVAV